MKKNSLKIKFAALFAAGLLIMSSIPTFASNDKVTDDAGNVFIASDSSKTSEDVQGDLFLAGAKIGASNSHVDGNVVAAGQSLSLTNVTVDGSTIMAGYTVDISSDVNRNIFAVGYTIDLESDTAAKAVYTCGAFANISGSYKTVHASAAKIYFDATVDGDVSLAADEVVFGENASIGGTLTVTASNEPDTSKVSAASYKFNLIENNPKEEVKKSAQTILFMAITKKIRSFIYWSLAFSALGLCLYFLSSTTLNGAAQMVTNRPLAMLLSGFISLICAPIAMIILAITVIGLPISGALLLIFCLLNLIAVPFTFASFGRRIIFGKTTLHPALSTVLSMVIAALVKVLPFVGKIISLCCVIYTFGYAIQKLYLSKKKVTATESQPLS